MLLLASDMNNAGGKVPQTHTNAHTHVHTHTQTHTHNFGFGSSDHPYTDRKMERKHYGR